MTFGLSVTMWKSVLSLPNELILAVILQSDTALDALPILQTNQRLRAIWLDNSGTIIDTLGRRHIPAYDAAYRLTRDVVARDGLSLDCPPVVVHHLLQNARLASSAVAKFDPWYVPLSG